LAQLEVGFISRAASGVVGVLRRLATFLFKSGRASPNCGIIENIRRHRRL